MKKFLALLCVAVICVACCIPVLAANDGKITINGAVVGQDYAIYKLLDLSYDDKGTSETTDDAYTYTVNSAWTAFFVDGTGALDYVAIDEDTLAVTWINAKDDEATVAEFAELALAFAVANNIKATESKEASSDDSDATTTSVVFENLAYGYYLVDSTVGTLCILNSTNKEFEKNEKNQTPSVEKEVQEDSNNNWGSENDATIGDVVNYKTTINVVAGAQGYVLHDKMEAGLSFNTGSVKVYLDDVADANLVDATNYGSTATCSAGCTFHVVFNDDYIKTVVGHKLIVTYSATINENAEIGKTAEGLENSNETWLQYGENSDIESNHDTTETYVFSFDLVKTDSNDKILDGAKFKLYDAETGGNEIKVVYVSDGVYRVAVGAEDGVEIVPVNGKATIKGLDSDTYYLEETVAPEGYNKLTARKDVTINGANNDATITAGVYEDGGVQVVNKTGAVLPETGGFGTTMFILIGGGLMLCTGILLVTKKRMEKIAD